MKGNLPKPTRLIGLAGGSGSGKSWLARRFQRWLPGQVAVLRLDDFYRDRSAWPAARRHGLNFDDPEALDWPLLEGCLKAITRQEPCRLPRYDFTTHTRIAHWRPWRPRPVVVVEGLWPLHRPRLRTLYDWTLFIDAPESLCLTRRLERDVLERGRSRASVIRQFRRQVAPMHRRFVAPQAAHADTVIGPTITPDTLAQLRKRLKELLHQDPGNP